MIEDEKQDIINFIQSLHYMSASLKNFFLGEMSAEYNFKTKEEKQATDQGKVLYNQMIKEEKK